MMGLTKALDPSENTEKAFRHIQYLSRVSPSENLSKALGTNENLEGLRLQ